MEGGNTVVVIEHNLDVIKTADWVIDMGPEGGDAGGKVVAEGTPEQVASIRASYTGRFLAPLLSHPGSRREPVDPAHAAQADGPAIALSQGEPGPPTGFRSRRGSGRPPAVSGSSGFRSACRTQQRRVAGGGGRPWDAA